MEATVTNVEVLPRSVEAASCVWCHGFADDRGAWISLNGRPMVPLCRKCQQDAVKVAQALVVFGRYVMPKMVNK